MKLKFNFKDLYYEKQAQSQHFPCKDSKYNMIGIGIMQIRQIFDDYLNF